MANDNLRELVEIRTELQQTQDLIHQMAKDTGDMLGAEFLGVLNLSKRLTSQITAAVEAQADVNNLVQTYAKSLKSANTLKRQELIIQKELESRVKTLGKTAKDNYTAAINASDIIIGKEKEVARLRELSAKATGNELTSIIQKISDAEKVIEDESKVRNDALKKDKVAMMTYLLNKQKEIVAEAIKADDVQRRNILSLNNIMLMLGESGDKVWKGLGNGLLKGVGLAGGLSGFFAAMVKSAFDIDASLTGIAKKSGLSSEATSAMSLEYLNTVQSLNTYNSGLSKALLTHMSMLKAQNELQESTDQLGLYTQQNVQSQMFLTKQLDMQADEAAKINQIALISSKTTAEVIDLTYEQTAALNKENGTRFRGKEILAAVAKIEGSLAVNYKNNPKLIAQAVVQAKALGLSLEQAAKASSSLLDFESSISNELEAELLTGKQFNLEKARSLALDGKSAEAAREMLKNIGGMAEFEKMNVIARESVAKAMGMTSDELSNSLRTQELMKGVSQETLKAIKESGDASKYNSMLSSATNAQEMKAAESKVTKQLEFEASMERVKSQLAVLTAGPLLKIVDLIVSATKNTGTLKTILIGTAAILSAMAISSMIIAGSMMMATGGLLGGMSALKSLGILAVAAGIGGGGAAYALSSPKKVNDGLISPTGQIMISTPEGMIKPNKNDYIGLSTNPDALFNSGGSGGSNKQERLLSAILDAVKQPSGVYMDTNKVGTSLGMKYSSYA
jgi:hypothetical protein